MAGYKNKKLDRKILAKIMMLEYIKPRIFNKIAEMALNNILEKELQSYEDGTGEGTNELKNWHDDSWFLEWCKLEPKLAKENLNTYFYFTRTSLDEKISRISSSLSPEAQNILEKLLSKSDINIKKAIEGVIEISDYEVSAILEAMHSKMSAETTINKAVMDGFLRLAQQRELTFNDTVSYLQSFVGSQVPLSCAGYIADFANKTGKISEIKEITAEWGKTNSKWENGIDSLLKK